MCVLNMLLGLMVIIGFKVLDKIRLLVLSGVLSVCIVCVSYMIVLSGLFRYVVFVFIDMSFLYCFIVML